ncbi:hypothetical protein ACHSBP_02785 [Pseudoalteromonas sp. XMcav1-K]|uniref:hypothetical protein n=1 Tax=Pseudoalteromonas sp. XMcav1-K TaxID=3374372 RepID=UPI0037565DE5
MRNLILAMLLTIMPLAVDASEANASKPLKIVTVSPISHSLVTAMVENTPIQVTYLPPKRLPVSRIPSWIEKNKTRKFDQFDAYVSMRSVKPQFDLYASVRQSNIRVVEIDIAEALLPKGEKVVLLNQQEYFWLNNNNLLLMLGILKRDLVSLWPQFSVMFNANQQALSSQIRSINRASNELLIKHDVAFMVANAKQAPFVNGFATDLATLQDAQALGLNYLLVDKVKKTPSPNTWHIDDFSRFNKAPLIARLKNNHNALSQTLSQL